MTELVTPPIPNRDVQEALNRLIASADVDNPNIDEYDVLAKMMVEAGLMWRCIHHGCRCLNHMDCQKCDNCGARRAKNREKPQPNNWA